MKIKNIVKLGLSVMVFVGLFGGYNYLLSQPKKVCYDFALKSIEALADDNEGGGGINIHGCYYEKDIDADSGSAFKIFVCSSGTTSGHIYKCSKSIFGKKAYVATEYKCYE